MASGTLPALGRRRALAGLAALPVGIGAQRVRAAASAVQAEGAVARGFRAGFYIYPSFMARAARQRGVAFDAFATRWMARLRELGFRLFYVAVQPGMTPFWVALAERLEFDLVLQLDFAYLYSTDPAEVDRKVRSAVEFIRRYHANPRVAAFSIREEPTAALMPNVARYFAAIRHALPDARLHLLHNDARAAAECVDVAPPDIYGVDRYPFWGWDPSGGGHAATPDGALDWYARELAAYARMARRCGGEFQVVFNSRASLWTVTRKRVLTGRLGDPTRILALAERGAVGWELIGGDRLRFAKYYRAPAHATRAMVWLAVLEGARSVLHWSGEPMEPALARVLARRLYRGDATSADPDEAQWLGRGEFTLSMFGIDDAGSPELDEFVEAVREIGRVDMLLARARPSAAPLDVRAVARTVRIGQFDVAGVEGRLLLVVDTAIGALDCGLSECMATDAGAMRIDALGNLVGFASASHARPRVLSWPAEESLVVLDERAEPIRRTSSADATPGRASGAIALAPGQGVFLFLGARDSVERVRWLARGAGGTKIAR